MTTTRKPQRRTIAAVVFAMFAALAAVPLGSAAPALAATGTTYYVSATGSDTNTGTSSEQPWRSLGKVNSTTFQPGDAIRLRSGDAWTGQLWPKGSGTDGAPITIDSYGTGAKPRIAGGGTVADAVRLFNQEYWEIRNLDVSNAAPATATPGQNLGDFRGIGVHGNNGQTLDHFVIDSVDVHDVTGDIKWIGGSGGSTPGITFGTGWDRSKNTGGIIFLTSVANIAAPGGPTVLDGITVQNSTIKNTSFAGITVKQYTGDAPGAVETGWGTRRTAGDTRFTPHTDVLIRGNYITQKGTQFGSNGVYLTNVRGGIVEDNVVDNVGVSGIETYAADQVTVQFNEVFGTQRANGSADGNGMDPDIATTNQVFQYNYLHDNEDGVLLCACNGNFRFGSAIVRYNVVTGSTRWNLHISQTSGTTAQVYNNVFSSSTAPNMTSGGASGVVTLSNNLFVSDRSDVAFLNDPGNVIYQNNGYSPNITRPSSESSPVVGSPQFVNSGITGPYGDENGTRLDTAANFALRAGSVFIDAGIEISGNGGRDFAGAAMPSGVGTDMGAFEAPGVPVRAVNETFDGLSTGPLANGKNGWRVVAANNAVDVVETPSAGDKSVRLQRLTDGGGTDGTNLARVFADPLDGVVTIEANVMRNDTQGGFFGLPYVYSADGSPAVSVAFANGQIRAHQGTTSTVVGSYQSGQWYRIALTIDTDAQRYSLDIDGQRVVSNATLRVALPGVARVAWYANGGERGSVHVDDVNIEATGPVSGQTYRIRNESTGRYLDSGAAGALALEPRSIYDDQLWTLTEQQTGYWTVDNVRSGRELLDTDPDGVVIWNTGRIGDDSLWAIDAVDGGFRIDNKLSGRGFLFGSGASVGWNTGAADANTVWTLEPQ